MCKFVFPALKTAYPSRDPLRLKYGIQNTRMPCKHILFEHSHDEHQGAADLDTHEYYMSSLVQAHSTSTSVWYRQQCSMSRLNVNMYINACSSIKSTFFSFEIRRMTCSTAFKNGHALYRCICMRMGLCRKLLSRNTILIPRHLVI